MALYGGGGEAAAERGINQSDLAHGGVQIKRSHVENRLAVTPPIAKQAPSTHTITCEARCQTLTPSLLLGHDDECGISPLGARLRSSADMKSVCEE